MDSKPFRYTIKQFNRKLTLTLIGDRSYAYISLKVNNSFISNLQKCKIRYILI